MASMTVYMVRWLVVLGSLLVSIQAFSESSKRPASAFERFTTLRFGNEQVVTSSDGSFDLRSLGTDEYLRLVGNVRFYPGATLSPESLQDRIRTGAGLPEPAILVPANQTIWQTKIHEALTPYGTYLLTVHFDEKTQLEFKLRQWMHPFKLYLVDRSNIALLDFAGTFEENIGEEGLITNFKAPVIRADVDGDFVLLLHVAAPNLPQYDFVNVQDIFIGRATQLYPVLQTSYFALGTIGGGLFIIALFYGFIYAFRSQDHSSLFLSLFSLFSAYLALHYFFGNNLSAAISSRVFAFANLLAIGFLMAYMLTRVRPYLRTVYVRSLGIAIAVTVASAILFSIVPMPWIRAVFLIFTYVLAFCLIILCLLLSIQYKLNVTLYLGVGAILNCFFQFVVFQHMLLKINADFGISAILGNFSMAICLALVNAKDFAATYRKAVEHDFLNQKLLKNLEEQEKTRTVFFHNTSHELRTPLNGIIGFLDLVRQGRYGALPTSVDQPLGKALRLAEDLKLQVNTILDLAKSKRGELRVRAQQFSLEELKRDADGLAEGLTLKSPGLSYLSTIRCEEIEFVSDRDKIYTIIRNLLGNAFKFRAPDRPNAVALTLTADREDLHIVVSDTGIGIPERFRDVIFEEFGQVCADARRAYEGTGLGLTMVRDLVKLLGGELNFESTVGVGTSFRVRIPRLKELVPLSDPPERSSVACELPESLVQPFDASPVVPVRAENRPSEGWQILVIDDNELNCEVITEILRADGYSLDYAVSGRAGLEQMRRKRPQLLLLDMMMPEMSGEDVIRVMREDPLLQEIPVILLTARASEEDRILGLRLGADDYLPKPIFAAELRLRVHNMMDRHRLLRQVERSAQEDKLLQLGELFADLAHELKNILQSANAIEALTPKDSSLALSLLDLSPEVQSFTSQAMVSTLSQDATHQRKLLIEIDRSDPQFRVKNRIRQNLVELNLSREQMLELWSEILQSETDALIVFDSQLKIFVQYSIMLQQLQRCDDLSRSILGYTRIDDVLSSSTTLRSSWEQCMSLLHVRLRRQKMRWDVEMPDVNVPIKPRALTQVFVNLVLNAHEAMSSQGLADAWIRVRVERRPDSVEIVVENAGSPISQVERLFQRGFSTKGEAGNGIGLYSSRRILKEVGGDLFYDGSTGHPRFVVILPLAAPIAVA